MGYILVGLYFPKRRLKVIERIINVLHIDGNREKDNLFMTIVDIVMLIAIGVVIGLVLGKTSGITM